MALTTEHTIVRLDEIVPELDRSERARFERLFAVGITYGQTVPPDEMQA